MSLIIAILIVCGISYLVARVQWNTSNAYKQATGHRLNTRNTIFDDIITGSIPGTEPIYAQFAYKDGFKQSGFHSLLSFEHNNMVLLFYGKDIDSQAFDIPYSNIRHYYYEIDEGGINGHGYQALDLYMTLTKGSIEISDIDLTKSKGLHFLDILQNKTVQGQQVKPSYNKVWYKHPIMHGRFIDHVMKIPQTSLDEQQQKNIQHRIAEDEANTAQQSQFKSSNYITKIISNRYSYHNK